jgi:crotonobetaine/carnitine-CoA ligase
MNPEPHHNENQLTPPLEVLSQFRKHNFTLSDAFQSRLEHKGTQSFCWFEGEETSWSRFQEEFNQLSASLLELGVKPGDRLSIMARNHKAHLLLLLAASQLKAIMVPINPDFGTNETLYVLEHAQPKLLFHDEHAKASACLAIDCMTTESPIRINIKASNTDSCANAKELQLNALINGASPAAKEQLNKLKRHLLSYPPKEQDTCLIIYTSGTTGFPKGVMHSQKNYLLAGETFVERMYLQSNDRLLIVLPFFHINALFYSVSGTLAAGASLAIVPRFSASQFWDQATQSKATVVNVIEAACQILKRRPREEFNASHGLRAAYGVRHSAFDTFQGEFHIPHLVSGYGMTEIPGVTCSPFFGLQKPGTMGPEGKHPDPSQTWAKCKVVDENGQDVGLNAVGELWVKTPIIMQGYYKDPEQTAAHFDEGWFKTGDLVSKDQDGYYTFVSRKNDIIRRRGENISALEIDRVIAEMPQVSEVATIAVPSELGEDDIMAVIVLKPNQPLSALEVRNWCSSHLAPSKAPRYVVFEVQLPYTPTHKIAKSLLRKDKALLDRAIDLGS